MQLYSDVIPDDKAKKRSRKRDGDEALGGARTPLSPQSEDITAPPTPALSDTSCSTPTRGSADQSDVPFSLSSSYCSLAPSSELEKQLSVMSAAQQRSSVLGLESAQGPLFAARLQVKVSPTATAAAGRSSAQHCNVCSLPQEEHEDRVACGGGAVKMEEGVVSPSCKEGDGGKELLRHLLKDKGSPSTTSSPTGQAALAARRQLSNESVQSEDEDMPGSQVSMVSGRGLTVCP